MIHETHAIKCNYAAAGCPTPDYQPTLTVYFPDNYVEINPLKKRPTIIICPGGSYERTSPREAEPVALRFLALGFNCAILRYSCKPAVFPAPQLELATAIALVRKKARAWHVDANRIFVMGFSAGGHLAASLGVFWDSPLLSSVASPEKIRPDALVLCYPVITSGEFAHNGSFKAILAEKYESDKHELSLELRVTERTPPSFIWHTHDDLTVPVENALLFSMALRKAHVPFELHIFKPGMHGLATATVESRNVAGLGVQAECQSWIDLAATWMKNVPKKLILPTGLRN